MKPWRSTSHPVAQQLFEHHYRAWTGGAGPKRFLQCSELERTLRSLIFRSEVEIFRKHWGDKLKASDLRHHYVTARYDAQAILGNMQLAAIELKFCPPYSAIVPGEQSDPGGYIYRIYYDDGRKRIGGTVHTLEESTAKRRALHSAARAGFTHYRMKDSAQITTLETTHE